jgi:hypothetical protein
MTKKYEHPPRLIFYDSPITMDRQNDSIFDEGAVPHVAE